MAKRVMVRYLFYINYTSSDKNRVHKKIKGDDLHFLLEEMLLSFPTPSALEASMTLTFVVCLCVCEMMLTDQTAPVTDSSHSLSTSG